MIERFVERECAENELHDSLLQSLQGLILVLHSVSIQLPKDSPLSLDVDSVIARAEHILELDRNRLHDFRASRVSLKAETKIRQDLS